MSTKTDQRDVEPRTEQTVDHLNNVVSWDVIGRNWPREDGDVILAACDENASTNGYAKARVINTVLSECPALEVRSTEDGAMEVTFQFKGDN